MGSDRAAAGRVLRRRGRARAAAHGVRGRRSQAEHLRVPGRRSGALPERSAGAGASARGAPSRAFVAPDAGDVVPLVAGNPARGRCDVRRQGAGAGRAGQVDEVRAPRGARRARRAWSRCGRWRGGPSAREARPWDAPLDVETERQRAGACWRAQIARAREGDDRCARGGVGQERARCARCSLATCWRWCARAARCFAS